MKYIDFYQKFKNRVLIDSREVRLVFPDFNVRRLFEWQQRGYIKKLVREFYVHSDAKIGDEEKCFIANKLFEPSYISLEYALSYYSLVPETVHMLTCITTRRTKNIETNIANFQYHSIKKNLFFGYQIININNVAYKIAEPEKALLDFLYLRSDIKNQNDIKELRLDPFMFKEKIDPGKLDRYLAEFGSATLSKKIKIIKSITL